MTDTTWKLYIRNVQLPINVNLNHNNTCGLLPKRARLSLSKPIKRTALRVIRPVRRFTMANAIGRHHHIYFFSQQSVGRNATVKWWTHLIVYLAWAPHCLRRPKIRRPEDAHASASSHLSLFMCRRDAFLTPFTFPFRLVHSESLNFHCYFLSQ